MSRPRCVSSRRGLQTAWWACVVLASAIAVANSTQAAEPASSHSNSASDAGESSRTRAEAQFAEGLHFAAAGKLPAAIDVFARLTNEYPQLPEPYAQLAALYVRQGQPAKAIAPLQTALSLNTDKVALQEQLGDLYVELAGQAYTAAGTARTSARAKAAALPSLSHDQSPTESSP